MFSEGPALPMMTMLSQSILLLRSSPKLVDMISSGMFFMLFSSLKSSFEIIAFRKSDENEF